MAAPYGFTTSKEGVLLAALKVIEESPVPETFVSVPETVGDPVPVVDKVVPATIVLITVNY